jgi:O-antigen/teichoic acid export membrane protein
VNSTERQRVLQRDDDSRLVGPRGRTIIQTGAWSIVAKASGAANLFISVPFVLRALGTEQFGIWATLCSFVTLTGFLDFGFGNGAMNLIASARGRNATHEYPLIIATAYRALIGATVWISMSALLAWLAVPWNRLLGIPDSLNDDCRWAAAIVICSILISVPLALATRLQLGMGQGERGFRWQAISSLLTLGTVVALALMHASLLSLTAAAVGVPLFGQLMNTIDLRRNTEGLEDASPRLDLTRSMRNSGFKFFILQLSATLAFSIDLPLITAILGPASAARFAIVQRLFSVIPMALSLLWVPLWPIYRNALAAGDENWVLRTFRRSLVLALCFSMPVAMFLLATFESLSKIWLGNPVALPVSLLLGFAFWCILDAVGGAIAAFLNAAQVMRPQLIIAIAFVALSLPLKLLGAKAFGISSIIWVTAALCLLVNLVPLFLIRRNLASAVWNKKH